MSTRVDLDAPEHALCSEALKKAKEDGYSSNRALHAAWAERDTANALLARAHTLLELVTEQPKLAEFAVDKQPKTLLAEIAIHLGWELPPTASRASARPPDPKADQRTSGPADQRSGEAMTLDEMAERYGHLMLDVDQGGMAKVALDGWQEAIEIARTYRSRVLAFEQAAESVLRDFGDEYVGRLMPLRALVESTCDRCGKVEENNARTATGRALPWGWVILVGDAAVPESLRCDTCMASAEPGEETS